MKKTIFIFLFAVSSVFSQNLEGDTLSFSMLPKIFIQKHSNYSKIFLKIKLLLSKKSKNYIPLRGIFASMGNTETTVV